MNREKFKSGKGYGWILVTQYRSKSLWMPQIFSKFLTAVFCRICKYLSTLPQFSNSAFITCLNPVTSTNYVFSRWFLAEGRDRDNGVISYWQCGEGTHSSWGKSRLNFLLCLQKFKSAFFPPSWGLPCSCILPKNKPLAARIDTHIPMLGECKI